MVAMTGIPNIRETKKELRHFLTVFCCWRAVEPCVWPKANLHSNPASYKLTWRKYPGLSAMYTFMYVLTVQLFLSCINVDIYVKTSRWKFHLKSWTFEIHHWKSGENVSTQKESSLITMHNLRNASQTKIWGLINFYLFLINTFLWSEMFLKMLSTVKSSLQNILMPLTLRVFNTTTISFVV